jgi:transcription-repair coupling factor (superfamily II helicase)
MNIQELAHQYARLPQLKALASELGKSSQTTVFLEGLLASSAPMLFASLAEKCPRRMLFVLQDAEEAGYFYHDLTQLMGTSDVLFFPSSYRRAVKYAQRDPASEILRTEVLSRLSRKEDSSLYVVTYPAAIAELVVSKKNLDSRILVLTKDQTIAVSNVEKTLREFGFHEVDYVYEPGQFALRGSILDVYSFSCEYPYRIDFFGDDIDSIRTFEVENQLSREQREQIEIVPELTVTDDEKVSFLSFVPNDVLLVTKDFLYVHDAIDRTYQEGFSAQAKREQLETATEMEQRDIERQLRRELQLTQGSTFLSDALNFRRIEFGHRPSNTTSSIVHLTFSISAQPLFHKNFDLLQQTFADYLSQGYKIYICADSQKQNERLKDILADSANISFNPVDKTLHEGFIDRDLRICVFTDHQIFDRFHKYNLRSDKARSGKMALTLKEIQQFEIGDFVVHVDHGVGKFGGLVRMPISPSTPNTPSTPKTTNKLYNEQIKTLLIAPRT